MGSKTQETTSETETRPSPEAMRHYQDILNQARALASTPLAKGAISPFATQKEIIPAYMIAGQFFGRGGRARYANGGETDAPLNQPKNVKNLKNEVAPLAKQQKKGIKQLSTAQNKQVLKANRQATNLLKQAQLQANQLKTAGQAEYNRAKQLAEQAAQVDSGEIKQYYDPYQQAVIDATMKEANQADSLEQARLRAQAVGRGAFGGGGYDLSRALLGGQQADARNKTLADLQSAGYSQALGAAQNEANRQAQIAAMYGQLGGQQYGQTLQTGQQYGNLANMQAGLGNTIMDQRLKQAQANIGGGSILQAQQQAKKNAAYNQRLQQAQYPYNTLNMYGGLAGGLGSLMGGTTSGTQTTSQPSNIFGQILGGLGSVIPLLPDGSARGGRVRYDMGGSVFDPVDEPKSPIAMTPQNLAAGMTDTSNMQPQVSNPFQPQGYADGGDVVGTRIADMFGPGGPLGGMISPTSGYDPAMMFSPEVIGQLTAPRPDASMLAAPTYTDTSVTSGFDVGPFVSNPGGGISLADTAQIDVPIKPMTPADFGIQPAPKPEITIRKSPATIPVPGAGVAGSGSNPFMAGNRILPFTPEQTAAARSITNPFDMFGGAQPAPAATPAVAAPTSFVPTTAAMNAPQNAITDLIAQSANKYGGKYFTPETMVRIGQLESNLRPGAQNPNSSAGGLFQFIDSTWKQYGQGNKMDPAANADAAGRYLADVGTHLEKVLGRPPTPGELYLGHQQGPGGAAKLLSNPDARAVDLVGADAVRLNGGRPDMTAREFANLWNKKLGMDSLAAYDREEQQVAAKKSADLGTLAVGSSQPMIDDAGGAPAVGGNPFSSAPNAPSAPRSRSFSERMKEDPWRMPMLMSSLALLSGADPGQALAGGVQAYMAASGDADEERKRQAEIAANTEWLVEQGIPIDTAAIVARNKSLFEATAKSKIMPEVEKPTLGEIVVDGVKKKAWLAPGQEPQIIGDADTVEPAPRPMTADERTAWGIPPDDKRPYGFVDGKPVVIGAGGQTVNVDLSERGLDKDSAKRFAERYDAIQTGGQAATAQLGLLDEVQKAIDTGIYTGPQGENIQALRRMASAVGLADADTAAAGDVVTAIQNRMALMTRSPDGGLGMPGALSDRDITFLKAMQPGLNMTPEGLKNMLRIYRALEDRRIQIADLATDYAIANDGLDYGFDKSVREFAKNNPLFPDEPPPGAAPTTPATKIQSDAEYDALPSGTVFVDPNGVTRKKP